jgi:outer membrane biosynthesis protein TonB
MKSLRKQHWQQLQSVFEPGFKQMLLVSVLLHLLIPVLYYSPLFPKKKIEKPPVYRVNLVNKIVKNPQAGRPEATPVKKKQKVKVKKKPKTKPKVVKPKTKPVPVKPKPKPKPKAKPKPAPKPVAKKKPVKKAPPKPAPKPKPKVSKAQENALQQRLQKMRAEQERKARIEALKAAALAESSEVKSPVQDAPVGMVDGKGDEAGVAAIAFVQEFIQQQWSFSKYQAAGNPEAEVELVYNKAGRLLHYKFLDKSGNSAFDESLIRAIAKSRQLPQPLPESMSFQILFNLKDMLDTP